MATDTLLNLIWDIWGYLAAVGNVAIVLSFVLRKIKGGNKK